MFFFISLVILQNAETDCFNAINLYRQEHRLQPLVRNSRLDNAARLQSQHQNYTKTLTHSGPAPDNVFFYDRIKNYGYDALASAENVCQGYGLGYKEILDSWKKSRLHNKNILNPIYNETGIACEYDGYDNVCYWTQVFAEKNTNPEGKYENPQGVVKSKEFCKNDKTELYVDSETGDSIQNIIKQHQVELFESVKDVSEINEENKA